MKKSKIVSLALAGVLALGLAGCGKDGDSYVPSYADLPEWQAETPFRFAAYMTPPPANVGVGDLENNPDFITDEQFKWIADCGFDYAYAIYESSVEDVKRVLDLCEKYDIKYLASDKSASGNYLGNLIGQAVNVAPGEDGKQLVPLTEEQKADMAARWALYKDSPAFAGHVAYDEPSSVLYDQIKHVGDYYAEALPGKEYYVNLLPSVGKVQCGEDSFEEYVEKFITTTNPSVVSYDKYSLLTHPNGLPRLAPDHLYCLETVATLAKKYNIPFYNFMLTMGHWSYRTPKNYDDLAWQLYTSMAYGVEGAQTFTYWTTMSMGEQITHGLVDWYGNRTQTWYSMQQLISEVRAMEDVYLNFDWQETMTYQADPDEENAMFELLKYEIAATSDTKNPIAGVASVSGDGDLLMGRFTGKDAGDKDINAYMLVNPADPENNVTLNAAIKFEGASRVLVYKKGRSAVYDLKKGVYNATVGSGEGQFVIPLA